MLISVFAYICFAFFGGWDLDFPKYRVNIEMLDANEWGFTKPKSYGVLYAQISGENPPQNIKIMVYEKLHSKFMKPLGGIQHLLV